MVEVYRRLFKKRVIPCVDADKTAANNSSSHGNALRDRIKNGLYVSPVKLIHYASVHYHGRYGASGRLLNSFVDLAHVFRASDKGNLILRSDENFELAGGTSEVLGVGLATALLSQVLPCDLREISKIEASGKRCDFQVQRKQDLTIFEARGRQKKSHIPQAASELPGKKRGSNANYIYGIISYLPRKKEPVEVYIFDPPGDENFRMRTDEETELMYIRHYSRVAKLCGLPMLNRYLEQRILLNQPKYSGLILPIPARDRVKEMSSNMIRGLVEHEGSPLSRAFRELPPFTAGYIDEKGKNTVKNVKKLHPFQYDKDNLSLKFGIDARIVENLWNLDFAAIDGLKFEASENEETLTSLSEDGSALFFS